DGVGAAGPLLEPGRRGICERHGPRLAAGPGGGRGRGPGGNGAGGAGGGALPPPRVFSPRPSGRRRNRRRESALRVWYPQTHSPVSTPLPYRLLPALLPLPAAPQRPQPSPP